MFPKLSDNLLAQISLKKTQRCSIIITLPTRHKIVLYSSSYCMGLMVTIGFLSHKEHFITNASFIYYVTVEYVLPK